jgi:hypothetical protein
MSAKKKIIIIGISIVGILIVTRLVLWWIQKAAPMEVPAFLPGIYACEAGNEFCHIKDTLVIHRLSLGGDHYTVNRKSAIVRIRAGKAGPPEYQQDQWEGVYDPGRQIVTVSGRADTVWYFPDLNRVVKKDFTYEKIE